MSVESTMHLARRRRECRGSEDAQYFTVDEKVQESDTKRILMPLRLTLGAICICGLPCENMVQGMREVV